MNTEELQNIALLMAVNCVRNTVIEDYHCGIYPSSETGDYSDVKVVTPNGEIPWNKVSRINDKEMKAFNKEVVNKLFTFLHYFIGEKLNKEEFNAFFEAMSFYYPYNWDTPKLDEDMIVSLATILKNKED